jgi:hypothetical protein
MVWIVGWVPARTGLNCRIRERLGMVWIGLSNRRRSDGYVERVGNGMSESGVGDGLACRSARYGWACLSGVIRFGPVCRIRLG